jgi:hypothetical protein
LTTPDAGGPAVATPNAETSMTGRLSAQRTPPPALPSAGSRVQMRDEVAASRRKRAADNAGGIAREHSLLRDPGVEQHAVHPGRPGHTGKSSSKFSREDRRTTPEPAGYSTKLPSNPVTSGFPAVPYLTTGCAAKTGCRTFTGTTKDLGTRLLWPGLHTVTWVGSTLEICQMPRSCLSRTGYPTEIRACIQIRPILMWPSVSGRGSRSRSNPPSHTSHADTDRGPRSSPGRHAGAHEGTANVSGQSDTPVQILPRQP